MSQAASVLPHANIRKRFSSSRRLRRFLAIVWAAGLLGLPKGSLAQSAGKGALTELSSRVYALRERVTQWAGSDDLLDTLYFGWFDQPYTRASLAVAVKTAAVLEREARLRARDYGAVDDEQLQAMIAWMEKTLSGVGTSRSEESFEPRRLRVTLQELTGWSQPLALFTFLDRTTSTRTDERFGDLDLLAAMGFHVYARFMSDVFPPAHRQLAGRRAQSLGMALVVVRPWSAVDTGPHGRYFAPVENAGEPENDTSRELAGIIQSVGLYGLLKPERNSSHETGPLVALLDSCEGESPASWLARRALIRGETNRSGFLVDGWRPPRLEASYEQRVAVVRLAMWLDAVEGLSLGIVHGWRDLRDGSGSPYASLFVDPAMTEVLARTALDLVRLGRFLVPFHGKAPVLITLDRKNLARVVGESGNDWPRGLLPLWRLLLARQIHYDLLLTPTNHSTSVQDGRTAWSVSKVTDDESVSSLQREMEEQLASDERFAPRVTVRERDGTLAPDVFLRVGHTPAGKMCLAVANLTGKQRTLRLALAKGFRLGAMRDLIAKERIHKPRKSFTLQPWRMRLFWPVD